MTWDGAFPFRWLPCDCKSGRKEIFEVRTEGGFDSGRPVWFYYARPSTTAVQNDEEYFASFMQVASGLLQLDGVTNGLPTEFQGCGLTRALIPQVAAQHSATIRSSRHRPSEGETRTEAATKVWESMVKRKIAYYDPAEDRYYFPPQPGAA